MAVTLHLHFLPQIPAKLSEYRLFSSSAPASLMKQVVNKAAWLLSSHPA
ncbi:hypothetical protein [Aeromonas sanarellii]